MDEALGFINLIKKTINMNYSTIIFDTAPTGHTLKLLEYPTLLKSSYEKLVNSSLGSMFKNMLQVLLNKKDGIVFI